MKSEVELRPFDLTDREEEIEETELHLRGVKKQKRQKRRNPPQPLSIFTRTAIVILMTLTSFLVILGVIIRQPSILNTAGLMMLLVALMLAGFRWVPILASAIGVLVLVIFSFVADFPLYHLSHPKDAYGAGVFPQISFLMFVAMSLIFWGCALLIITGVAAVVHNYTQRVRNTPYWFKTAMSCAIGVLFGAILLGLIQQPAPVSASANTVQLGAGSFSQTSITITKGSTLTLVDSGSFHHNISDGTWVNGQPVLAQQPGEPAVKNQNLRAAGATLKIGPFNTAGTFHILCSIHHNMMLTIIVQ